MNEPAEESTNQTQTQKKKKTKTLVKLRCWFDQFHSALLKEICSFRPIPPILGDSGRVADLFKLFLVVRGKGGSDAVSREGLWASVAEESGLGLGLAAAVKLVYLKYLDCFERWLDRVLVFDLDDDDDDDDVDEVGDTRCGIAVGGEILLMEIQDEFKGFLSEIAENRKTSGKKVPYRDDDDDDDVSMAVDSESVGSERLSRKRKSSFDDDEDEEGLVEETEEERKAGREALMGIVDWVKDLARDPGDPSVGSIPEPAKWRSEDNADDRGVWRKLLLAREALFLKRNIESEQKNQRMHPSMYSDQLGSAYNLRERLNSRKRLFNEKSASERESSPATSVSGLDNQNDKLGATGSSGTESLIYRYSPSRIPTGPAYQAEVPVWTGESSESSDSKWLGRKVWPLDKSEQKLLLERDPIGKGRQTSCGCQETGSVECVRFHVAEKRLRVKRELGSAFYLWRFDKMGEDVRMFWTAEEEKKFKGIVSSNPPSLETSFWDQIFKAFPRRSRADLVSYYYNAFVLSRRAHQNRFTPSNIDSDDEELEPSSVAKETPEAKKSILLTPNKQHRK